MRNPICPKCKKNKRTDNPNVIYCLSCEAKRNIMNAKLSNYKNEKTENQRFLRNIKRQTRYYFPLKNHNCEFCGKKAEEHHHNTIPISFDKFNYVCHECHILKNKELKGVYLKWQ